MFDRLYTDSLMLLAGICVYSAILNCTLVQRGQRRHVHLLFAGMAFLVSLQALTVSLSFQATSVASYVEATRLTFSLNVLIFPTMAWFLAEYSSVRSMPAIVGLSSLFALLFLVNLTQPYTMLFKEIHGLEFLTLPWGERVALPLATPGVWAYVTVVAVLLAFVFGYYASAIRLRRERKRTTLITMAALSGFLFFIVQSMLVRLGILHFIPLGPFGFLGMVIVMGQTLNHEMQVERKRAEEALLTNERRLSLAISATADAVWEWNVQTGETYYSPRWYQMLGYNDQPREMDFNAWKALCHPDDFQPTVDLIQATLNRPKSVGYAAEFRMRKADGSWGWIMGRGNVVERDAAGRPLWLSGTNTDISERKRAEAEMRESEERFRSLTNASLEGLMIHDNGVILDANPAFVRLFGYDSLDELIGRNGPAIMLTPESQEIVRQRIQQQLSGLDELACIRKNGSTFVAETDSQPITFRGRAARLVSMRDVTERKRAEEELRLEKAFFEKLLDSLPGIFYLYDDRLKLRRWNRNHETATGFSADELRGKSIESWHVLEADRDRAVESVRAIMAGTGGGGMFETPLLHKDGSVIPYLLTRVRIDTPDGPMMMGVGMDITARVRAEQALRESEERYKALFERSLDCVFLNDFSGHFTDANQAALNLLGYNREDITHLTFASLLSADQIPVALKRLEEIIAAGYQKNRQEFRLTRKDGKHVDVEIQSSIILRDGKPHAVQGIARDITERKRAEERIRNKEFLLSQTQRIAHIGTWSWDVATQEFAWSDETYRLFGVTPETFQYSVESFLELIHPDDRTLVKEWIVPAMAGHPGKPPEFRAARPDGSIRFMRARHEMLPGQDMKRPFIVGTVQDVTEVKQAEEERGKIETQLFQSQKMDAIGNLAGGVAHDFNNQLNVIQGYADILAIQLDQPKLKRYAANIGKAVQRSADLTKKLLAFARKGQNKTVPVQVHKLIAETMEMLDRTIDKRIVVKHVFAASSDVVLGDPSQIQNALLNLGVNARDAMPAGGMLVFETEIAEIGGEFSARRGEEVQAGSYIKISVTDTGSGMTDDVKKHLFEPFFTTKPVGKGTGLGLASVFGTVKNHKGTLDVYSEIGHGTTFKIYLPLAEPTHDEYGKPFVKPPSAFMKALKKLRVLLVEDEEVLRILFRDMVEPICAEYLEAENGRQAVEMYQRHWQEIDVVVLDMIMPEMNGADAFRAMKSINPGIKALLSTGYSLNNEVQQILDEGVRDFIQKPFMRHDLIEKIIAAMG